MNTTFCLNPPNINKHIGAVACSEITGTFRACCSREKGAAIPQSETTMPILSFTRSSHGRLPCPWHAAKTNLKPQPLAGIQIQMQELTERMWTTLATCLSLCLLLLFLLLFTSTGVQLVQRETNPAQEAHKVCTCSEFENHFTSVMITMFQKFCTVSTVNLTDILQSLTPLLTLKKKKLHPYTHSQYQMYNYWCDTTSSINIFITISELPSLIWY